MARPWYSFYPSDYARDTGHLTLIEHGAYRVPMDHYYAAAAPLPPDVGRLLRLCRAQEPAEQEAVRFVLGEFFADGEAVFAPGPPAMIVLAAPYLRDLIARKFPAALWRCFGEFALEAAA